MTTIKMFIVTIGYMEYAVPPEEIGKLIDIMRCSPAVSRRNYTGPYRAAETPSEFISTCTLGDLVVEDDAPEPEAETGEVLVPSPAPSLDDDENTF